MKCQFCGEPATRIRQPDVYKCSVCGEMFLAEEKGVVTPEKTSGETTTLHYVYAAIVLIATLIVTMWTAITEW